MTSRFKAAQLKLSSFYGTAVPRPYVLLDGEGNPVDNRVDAPAVNDALMEWASKVPFQHGGALVKPQWDGPEMPREPRSEFQIFFQERAEDIQAANPAILPSDRRAMLSAASVFWRERLTSEERAAYREQSAAEKAAVTAQIAEAEESNPKFKAFREKLQKYKHSMSSILSAAKASTGPLWRVQRRMNKYRLLEEREAAARGEENEVEMVAAGGSSKGAASRAGGSKKRGGGKSAARGSKAAAQKRLVDSDDDSDEEEEAEGEEQQAEQAAAIAAMQKLLLASAKKGGKPAKAGRSQAAAPAPMAAPQAGDEEESSDSEEDEGRSPSLQPVAGSRRTRSGAAALAGRLGSKGRNVMYADAFELPPSQSTTPAKPRGAAPAGKGRKAANQPAKSPGKRLRTTRHSAAAAAPAMEESPAKKPRRSARK